MTLREQMDAALGSQELMTLLSNFFGILALLLSALGLYELLSASVVQRTNEIGMRLALGANRHLVIRMILREALGLLARGLLLGAIVFGLRYAIRYGDVARSFGIRSTHADGSCGLADRRYRRCRAVPALRAAAVDPIETLRAE